MPAFARVHVTDHAMQRWRERVAVYGNAKVQEILAAFKDAVEIPDHEPLPVGRMRNSRYYRDDQGVYFVVEPLSRDEFRLVTIMPASMVHASRPSQTPESPADLRDEATRLDWLARAEVFEQEPAGLEYGDRQAWHDRQTNLVKNRLTLASKLERELAWRTMNILRARLIYLIERKRQLKNERLAARHPKRWHLPGIVGAEPCVI